jgi:hypothetical protein
MIDCMVVFMVQFGPKAIRVALDALSQLRGTNLLGEVFIRDDER